MKVPGEAAVWAGRRVWITGASSGIGLAMAEAFAAAGARLILSGRRRDALESLARSIGDCLVLPFETTEWGVLSDVTEQATQWAGGLDLLINNAGVTQRSLAIDTALSVYQRLIDVDLLAPIALTQTVLPELIKSRGQVAVISSLAGKIGAPLRTGYCAAKHGCVGYFEALRAEIEQAYGVGVTVVLPGSVQTDIARNALSADGSVHDRSDQNIDNGFSPADVAGMILDGLVSRTREIVIARGAERAALEARVAEPEGLFAQQAEEGARLAKARGKSLGAWSPDPALVNSKLNPSMGGSR